MATSTRTVITELGGILATAHQLDSDGAANVTGGSSGMIYLLDIDNRKNTSAVYAKIKDHASTVGSGETADMMFKGSPGVVTSYVFEAGVAYAAGVSIWCTTSPVVANDTSPTNPVTVSIVAS